jgi:RNA polymerase sigma-70 factor (family 1)
MQVQGMPIFTDQELLEKLRQDNADAFEIIYKKYFPRLYAHAYKLLKDKDACKDIIQEIFSQLWFKRHTQEIKALDAYLHAATRFQVFKAIRSGRCYENLFDVADELPVCRNTENLINEKEMALTLYNGIAQLPEKCRTIFYMSRMEYLSNKDIALKLSIAPKTVENQLTIAFRKLRVNFREYLPALLLMVYCCR